MKACPSFELLDGSNTSLHLIAVDLDVLNEDQPEFSYLVAPFGDLKPGTCVGACFSHFSLKQTFVTGSLSTMKGGTIPRTRPSHIFCSHLCNNEKRSNDAGVQTGQSQNYSFSLQYWTPGMAVFLATTDNSTSILWNLDGTLGQPTSNSSGTVTLPTSTSITSGYGGRDAPIHWVWVMMTTWMFIFASLWCLVSYAWSFNRQVVTDYAFYFIH